MCKILFLGLAHGAFDPRLFHKQISKIVDEYKSIECVYIGRDSFGSDNIACLDGYRIVKINTVNKRKLSNYRKLLLLLSKSFAEKPSIVQASHVIELPIAILLKVIYGTRIIFDSHEDYFRQSYDYSGESFKGLMKGVFYKLIEIFFIRFVNCVFTTDDHLFKEYSKPLYGKNQIFLFRNFVDSDKIKKYAKPPVSSEKVKIVYVGGINEYRGITDCASFVLKYNNETSNKLLEFHVYGQYNAIVDKLLGENKIFYHGNVEHAKMYETLSGYHIGVCLLKNIKKFHRNLPMKNFEYMAVGVPIITSNFYHIKKYVEDTGSGICINPDSYDEFRDAVNNILYADNWLKYSFNCLKSSKHCYGLKKESKPYLECIRVLSGLPRN